MKIIDFLQKSINGEISAEEQEEFLKSNVELNSKELANVVRFLMKQMPKTPKLECAIDICGTGGSGLKRINTSTISAFIIASLGVKVAKHGNRAASGRVGSFDLIEALGIKIMDSLNDIETLYRDQNLAFMFAPFFHPVMRHFAEVRKKIGKPTFFNLLGPLLNPARVKRQIIGTTFKDKMQIIAETCKLLGKEKVYVVCGEDDLDEVTLTGRTFVTELNNGKISNYTISPIDFGIKETTLENIQGGDINYNTKLALEILNGKLHDSHLDLVLINSALALKLAGNVKTLKSGYKMALEAIKSGVCFEKFEQFKTLSHTSSILLQIVENKRKEVEIRKNKYKIDRISKSKRDFIKVIKGDSLALIAEVKGASPTGGQMYKGEFLPVQIAQKYEKDGADAISVVCDKKYFQGDLKYLKAIQKNTVRVPLLCKDFIIDKYQIKEARKYGADAILLIASILTEQQIKQFIQIAKDLKMAAICEVHTIEETGKVLKTPAKIIGINNRNLNTFELDLSATKLLADHIPSDKIIISESGIKSKEDMKKLPKNINAVLVGTALMKGLSINELINK